MGTDGDIGRIIIIADLRHTLRCRNIEVAFCFHARGKDRVDIPLQPLSRETVVRDTVAEHTAQLRAFFENGDLMSHDGQKICRRKSGRAAADDSDLLAGVVHLFRDRNIAAVVHRETFQTADIDRRIHQRSSAALFARMLADQRTDGRERVVLADQSDRVCVSFVLQKRDITRNIDPCRAHRHARYRLRLVLDVVCAGVVFDMRFEIIPISLQSPEYHVRGLKTDGTVCRNADRLCGLFQQVQDLHPRLRVHFQNVIDHQLQLSEADTARNAFSAAL